MRKYTLVAVIALALCSSVLVQADTAPDFEGETWGGGIDFTCDDDPCNPKCVECNSIEPTGTVEAQAAEGLDKSLEGWAESSPMENEADNFMKSDEVCELQTVCELPEDRCFVSTNKKNYDKCIWSGDGPECEVRGRCCEYPKGADGRPDKSTCSCLSAIVPSVPDKKCAECLCLGEAESESPECKAMMLCVLHNDAAELDPDDPASKYCEAATAQVPSNKDAWRFSAARCSCDRSTGPDDDRGKNGAGVRGYNQTFCDCIEGKKLPKATQKKLAECKSTLANLDCKDSPYTHYATGSTAADCPCARGRVKSTKVCGGHIFCDCS